jgi:hypothetical protein
MGFMDKAKKLADQAQQKLDDVQEQFNQSQASSDGERPEGTPAGEAPPPAAEPVDAGPVPDAGPAPGPDTGDSNANPDPFKPLQ